MMSVTREQVIASFLNDAGHADARRVRMSGDASFRRYERLHRDGQSLILMDAPPPRENVEPFLKVAALLQEMGLTVPKILKADRAQGLLLLEDLGDETFTRALQGGREEEVLYTLATDALIEIHRRLPEDLPARLPVHDDERCLREVGLLLEWYWPALFGGEPALAVCHQFMEAWRQVLPLRAQVPQSIALFDFHVDNLMLVADRSGIAACGLLDFQDAVIAPLGFDLASLLEDVRRDVSRALKEKMRHRFLAAFPDIDGRAFDLAYAVSAAQRNVRIVGTFARLLIRDGKPAYQSFMPRVWQLIDEQLAHPALDPVAAWFNQYLPGASRRPLCGAGR